MILDEVGSSGSERGIAGKEAGDLISLNKIHICGAPPAIDSIPVPSMDRRGGMNSYIGNLGRLTRCYWNSVAVALFGQPLGDGRRSEQRNVVRKRIQRIEGQMIRVRVRQKNRIQFGQRIERYPRSADPGKKFAEGRIEVRVRKQSPAGN